MLYNIHKTDRWLQIMSKNSKQSSLSRSIARGGGARGLTGINSNGKDAYKRSKQSTKGHYKLEFIETYDKITEKDIELRKVYGIDLVSANVGVPTDMIRLKAKKKTGDQTLTSLDEVYYVKVGKDTYGKLSIRTQRLWKSNMLIFVFQKKKTAPKPPQKAFSRKVGFKKRTAGQKSQASRKSYRTRREGKH